MSGTKQKGLPVVERKLATKQPGKKLTGNQYQNTPQQNLFMKLWTDPDSTTFGNAYESAVAANYAPSYAVQLTSPAVLNKWIQEYKRRIFYSDEHIRQGIQKIASKANNSKSPDDTRLKAYEILAKITGMIDSKNTTNVTLVQPILSGNSVRQKDKNRVVIESE